MKLLKTTSKKSGGLPYGYQEVEYIKANGTGYFDTGYKINNNTKIELVVNLNGDNNANVFGSRASSSDANNKNVTLTTSSTASFCIDFTNSNYSDYRYAGPTNSNSILAKIVISKDERSVTNLTTGVLVGNSTTTCSDTFECDSNAYIFNVSGQGYFSNLVSKTLLYSCKIWDNDTLIRDFIPCLNPLGTPCLYDLVEEKTYYNVVSGNFTYGRKIFPVEYLQSSGTEYISTGTKFDCANTTIEIKTKETSLNQVHSICGNDNNNFYYFRGTGNWAVGYNATAFNADSYMVVGDNTFRLDRNNLYMNGTLAKTYTASSTLSSADTLLFNRKTALTDNGPVTMYYCKIWNNDVLIRDYIPVRDENNTGYMFDKVNHTLYENLGSGSFTLGEDLREIESKLLLLKEKVTWSGLPIGYKRVEYLQSTGTQYIDTEYQPVPATTKFEFMFSPDTITGNSFLFGCRPDTSAGTATCTTYFATGNVRQDWAGLSSYFSALAVGDKVLYSAYNNTISLNDSTVTGTNARSTTRSDQNFLLYTINTNGIIDDRSFIGKVYYSQLWDDGKLVRDFVPCLDPDGVPCLYDLVQGKPYYNAGSGDFTAGRQIIPVEYLESTGTQYILTGFTPTLNTDFEIELSSISTGTNAWAMGCPTWVGVHYKGATNEVGITSSSTAAYQQYTPYNHDNSRITMKLSGDTVYANGVSLGMITRRAGTLDFALFGYRDANQGATILFKGSIYKTKIWENGVLVRDYLPAIDENGVGFMFDKVTGTCFLNAGTGAFSAGDVIPNAQKVRILKIRNKTYMDLPLGYKAVEYIKCTGTQYIDTGYKPNSNTKVEAKFVMNESPTSFKWLFLARNENAAGNGFGFGCITNGIVASEYNDRQTSTDKLLTDTAYIITKDKNICKFNDKTLTNPVSTFTVDYTLPIFALNNVGTVQSGTLPVAQCHYFKIYDNDILVRDFVPALDRNNRPCMFDKVEGKTYYNKGTDEFRVGRQIIPVTYIGMTGMQYINTGLLATDDYGYRIKNTYTAGGGEQCAIGGMSSENRFVGIYTSGSANAISGAWGNFVGFLPNYTWTTDTILDVKGNYRNNRKLIIDNTELKDISDIHITGTVSNAVFVGARNFGSTITGLKGKIYSAEITNGSEVIMDLIPAIDENNVAYLFDKVTRTCFLNAGTGTFSYGNRRE